MHIFNTNDCMRLVNGATDVNWVGTPKTIRDRLDMMSKTGRPIHVSEVTIAAPGEDDRSREMQAALDSVHCGLGQVRLQDLRSGQGLPGCVTYTCIWITPVTK